MEAFQIIENKCWNNCLSFKEKRYISSITSFRNKLINFLFLGTGIAGAKQAACRGGGAAETTSVAGKCDICGIFGKGGNIWGMVRAGFSLSEKGVTNMESENPEVISVMLDWRNRCEFEVLSIF